MSGKRIAAWGLAALAVVVAVFLLHRLRGTMPPARPKPDAPAGNAARLPAAPDVPPGETPTAVTAPGATAPPPELPATGPDRIETPVRPSALPAEALERIAAAQARVSDLERREQALAAKLATARMVAERDDPTAHAIAMELRELQESLRQRMQALPGLAEAKADREAARADREKAAAGYAALRRHIDAHGKVTPEAAARGETAPRPRADCPYCAADFGKFLARDPALGKQYGEQLRSFQEALAAAANREREAVARQGTIISEARRSDPEAAALQAKAREARARLDARLSGMASVGDIERLRGEARAELTQALADLSAARAAARAEVEGESAAISR